jgi:hypothetical protein
MPFLESFQGLSCMGFQRQFDTLSSGIRRAHMAGGQWSQPVTIAEVYRTHKHVLERSLEKMKKQTLLLLTTVFSLNFAAIAAEKASVPMKVKAKDSKTFRTSISLAPSGQVLKVVQTQVAQTPVAAPKPATKSLAAQSSTPVVTPAMTSSLSMQAPAPQSTGRFHSIVSLSVGSNLYKTDSPDREAATEVTLVPSFQITEKNSVSLKSIVTHEETGARNTALSNTVIGLKRTGTLIEEKLTHSYGISGIVPTNEDSRKRDRLQGGLSLSYGLKSNWKIFETSYSLSATRNFHEFTVNADGDPNIQYGIAQSLGTSAALFPKWTLDVEGLYKFGWTYNNFQRTSFGFAASINYEVAKAWTLTAGINTEGSALKASGTGSNIKAYDENTTVVLAGITFVN